MSRSNPTSENPNPSTRCYSWSGSKGVLKYFDKEAKEEKEVGDKFTFLLLDNLSSIKGWHEPSESNIFSNEVRDTRSDRFVVKSFKGGVLSEGFYADIKDRVNSLGGKFSSNLYIAFKDGDTLKIGVISFSGAALSAWMDFSKANKAALLTEAVQIDGSKDGKKGSVKFKTPVFALIGVAPATNEAAVELDKTVQTYLSAYLAKNKTEQVKNTEEQSPTQHPYGDEDVPDSPIDDSDPGEIPF